MNAIGLACYERHPRPLTFQWTRDFFKPIRMRIPPQPEFRIRKPHYRAAFYIPENAQAATDVRIRDPSLPRIPNSKAALSCCFLHSRKCASSNQCQDGGSFLCPNTEFESRTIVLLFTFPKTHKQAWHFRECKKPPSDAGGLSNS